jgi:hypothetical protein
MKTTILKALILLLVLFLLQERQEAFSAPDPAEVEEMKLQAPLHLIGKVENDEFFGDVPNQEYLQTRKMTISASEVVKAPGSAQQETVFEIFYRYIPSWMADEFIGPVRMDITKGDIIEIWLEEGKEGWEPVLSGATVNHLYYTPNRDEALKEPFLHKAERLAQNIYRKSGVFTALIFSVLLLAIFLLSKRNSGRKVI